MKNLLLIIALIALAGCGSGSQAELAAVTGQVLLDGSPLATGSVITSTDQGRGARGEIQSDGSFALATADLGPGAVPGTHRVAVVALETSDSTTFNPEAPRKLIVPQKYTVPDTSELVIEVQANEENHFVLELNSRP